MRDHAGDYPPGVSTAALRPRRRRRATAAPSGTTISAFGLRRGAQAMRAGGGVGLHAAARRRRPARRRPRRNSRRGCGLSTGAARRACQRGRGSALPCRPSSKRAAERQRRSRAPRPGCPAGRGTAPGPACRTAAACPASSAPSRNARGRARRSNAGRWSFSPADTAPQVITTSKLEAASRSIEATRCRVVRQRRPGGRLEAVGAQQAHQQFAVAVVDLARRAAACRARHSSSPVVNTATVGRCATVELIDAERRRRRDARRRQHQARVRARGRRRARLRRRGGCSRPRRCRDGTTTRSPSDAHDFLDRRRCRRLRASARRW